jgi:AraC-like DNA-binding protein
MVIILAKQKVPWTKKGMFGIFVFSLTYNNFLNLLILNGYIIEYPHFYRTGSPFMYLFPISFLLYSEMVLFQKNSFDWRYGLLFIVPWVHCMENMPFYLEGQESKIEFLNQVLLGADNALYLKIGWISNYWHYLFQFLFGVVLICAVMIRFYTKTEKKVSDQHKWISVIAIELLVFLVICTATLFLDTQQNTIFGFGTLVLSITLLSIFINLFLSPTILYALPSDTANSNKKKGSYQNPLIALSKVSMYSQKIEAFYRTEKAYLTPNFRQQDLADYLGISKNILSYVINTAYKKNFNQHLNEKRIEVVLEKFAEQEWQNLSLDGVASKVGFQSRTTFNKFFKEKTGKNPSAYRK